MRISLKIVCEIALIMVSERKHRDVECGKVYRIYDLREPGVTLYVGSTEGPVSFRYANHMLCVRGKGLKSRNHVMCDYMVREGVDNFHWELLHQLVGTTRTLMRQAEQEYMDQLKPRFNRSRAYTTKEHATAQQNAKIVCACGSETTKRCYATHKKSKKHQAYIALEGLRI